MVQKRVAVAMVAILASILGQTGALRDELLSVSDLTACEEQVDLLQRENAQLRLRVQELEGKAQSSKTSLAEVQVHAAISSFKLPQARSLMEIAASATEGELIQPSPDVLQVLGDVSSQLAVKKQEAAVQEEAARVAAMMAAQAVEENNAAGEVKDEKEQTFNKLLEEYEKAEEAAMKKLETATAEMETDKANGLKAIADVDDRLKDAEKGVRRANGLVKLSTTNLNNKKPDLEKQIQSATTQIKDLVAQQTEDKAKLEEAKHVRDAIAEELQKTKDTHDQKTQEALDELTASENKWLDEIQVLSDKVDEAERKFSEAKADATAARSVSATLTLMLAEKKKEHEAAMKALEMYTMGDSEMKMYQKHVDTLYGFVTNCERKWFKGGLRSKLMDSESISSSDVEGASKLQKPRSEKDQEAVFTTMKTFFKEIGALKIDTGVFGSSFPNFSTPMDTTYVAVETETMKLANMACKYWAVTKGGEATASDSTACSLFKKNECGGQC